MKLRIIHEEIVDDQDMANSLLGTAAEKTFKNNDKLPEHINQYKPEQVDYKRARTESQRCGTCKHFIEDGGKENCLLVDIQVHPDAVCDLWNSV